MMSKISALYDDEDALSNVQKAAQRAQMRKRAQASSFTGMECEGILHKLPMKKHGILGAGKDRVFKLSACVLRYFTVRTHKLKGAVTLMPNAHLEENINSAGDLMSFSLSVPDVTGKLVVQRSVFTYDEAEAGPGSSGAQPTSPRLFQPGYIDPLSKFVQCIRNSIALLRKKPDMEGVLRKLPMSGKPGKGELARYFTLQGTVLRYFGGGSIGNNRNHFHTLKGNIGLTKQCILQSSHSGLGISLKVPGQGTLIATADTKSTANAWFMAINAALMRIGGGNRPPESGNTPPMSRVNLVTSMSQLGIDGSVRSIDSRPSVPPRISSESRVVTEAVPESKQTLSSRGSSLFASAIAGKNEAHEAHTRAVPVVAVRGTVTEHNSSRTRVTATQVVAAAAVETTAAPTKVVSPGSATNESVESFLQELGLERFSTACEEEGYDSLRLLAQMEADDYAAIGMKRGHIRILERALHDRGLGE
eukprot:INCI15200.1.p1 GENE.INCI15200.1~~INCI15200.1.p1  ORF type:complete len:476 (-),score=66.07 INCI15200.1:146-1573(-)